MMTRRSVACLLLSIALMGSTGSAATYYVAADGNDENAGTTPGAAFRTVARGIEPLQPGDTLAVGPGLYHEQVFIEKSGTREHPITIRAAIPGRTELVGSVRLAEWSPVRGRAQVFSSHLDRPSYLVYEKDTNRELFEVANLDLVEQTPATFFYDEAAKQIHVHPSDDLGMAHHVVDACVLDYGLASRTTDPGWLHTPRRVGLVIEGFVVRDYNTYGVFIHNADYCEVRNCIVHHCRRGIFTYSSLRSRIADCEVFACADRFNREQGNIGMMGYIFECVQENNLVHRTRQHGIRFYGGSYGNILRGNLAYDCSISLHVKGQLFTHEQAIRYARFSDDGHADLAPDLQNVFERNACHRVAGSTGLIPNGCVYRHNTGEKSSVGRALKPRSNLELASGEMAAARLADPVWHDLRLQSDSPYREAGAGGEDRGAYPYRDEVFYVGPDGSDEGAGTCATAPWQSLPHAMAKLKAGDTLYLLPGIYREALRLTDLVSDGRPTTIRAYGKGEVVLDGEGATEGGLKLVACRNVSIQGLRIRGAAGQALRIQNSSVVRIEENEFVDNPGTAIHVVGDSVDVRVLHNTIAFNGGTGVVSAPAARGLWVVSNIIRENASSLSLPDGPPPELFADYNNVTDAPAAATGPHDVDLPPGFADAARRDLRLSRISLCRGRGYLDRAIGAQRLEPAAGDDLAATKLRALAVTATTADLAWSIAGGKATMIVAYGTAPDQLTNVIVRDTGHWYRRHHTTTLQGLEPGSRYYVRVGYRQLLDGPAPYHSFRYLWPERTPAGEAEYYATLARRDIMGTELLSFVTRTENVVTGRELHVTVTGSDAAPGTAEAPLRSIVCACRMVQPGDRVLVHEGTYTELLRPSRSGLPGHPIVFEAAPGQRVELSGGRELIPYGADLRDRHHVVLRGFVFSGQSELDADRGGFGHVAVVGASDILVERCLFDGRMNYVNAIQIHRSREVTIHNNLFVSHHASMMVYDNPGTVTITRNSLLGPTLAKIYGPRNERLVIRNNLFGEHLFPKKKKQYKLKLPLVKEIDADYNLYYFDPANDERRLIDYMPPIPDPSAITAQPEDDPSKKRMGVKGDLEAWRTIFKQGRHSFIADPKWAKPEAVKAARSRSRGWPNRFFKYEPLRRADFAIAADSPCIGAGENGVTVGADTSY